MLAPDEMNKLLMIPGPSPVREEILRALAEPTISHTSQPMADIIRDCLDGLRTIAETKNGQPFAFGGSGTLAQEAAIVNLVAPGERLLVVSNGFFGDRFVPIAQAHGIDADRLASSWGRSVTTQELDDRLSAGHRYRAVTITHVETSTGVLAPLDELSEVVKRHNLFLIVDAVCAFGGLPTRMDSRGIDIVITGAQKALGVPPGLSILVVSERAMARRRELGTIATYYADLLNWNASMLDPTKYFSTHSVNLFYALRLAVEIILEEGLEARFERHRTLAEAFRAGATGLGFTTLTEKQDVASTLSVLEYPTGVQDQDFRVLLGKHGVVAAGCLGDWEGRAVRFGHMGNTSYVDVLTAVQAMEESLQDLGRLQTPGAGVRKAQELVASATAR